MLKTKLHYNLLAQFHSIDLPIASVVVSLKYGEETADKNVVLMYDLWVVDLYSVVLYASLVVRRGVELIQKDDRLGAVLRKELGDMSTEGVGSILEDMLGEWLADAARSRDFYNDC